MRTFELLTVVTAALGLLAAFTRRSKRTRARFAGICLLSFLLHAAVEGIRWQLTLAYVVVALLAGFALFEATGRLPKLRIPRFLEVFTLLFLSLGLAVAAFLAYALPVFRLPTPGGPSAVGIQYLHLVDEHRREPFRNPSLLRRELMVKLYYPGKPENAKPVSRYFRGSIRLLGALAAFYQMPPVLFEHLRLIQTHGREELELSEEQARYPVVLFSHGAGTSMEMETSQCEDLASHGYVVAAVDHPYVSAATEFPGRIVGAREATTNFDVPEPAVPITQIMVDDQRFVLAELGELNAGHLARGFQGKLNLEAIGVIGHSVGGAVAYQMANQEARIKAAINLDGAVYITPRKSGRIAPFLILANDRYHSETIQRRESLLKWQARHEANGGRKVDDKALREAQLAVEGLADVLKRSGTLYTIQGSDHMKFADLGLFIGNGWLRELLKIGGQTPPSRCLEITQALTAAFFDRHLKGKPAGALEGVTATYPELKKVRID